MTVAATWKSKATTRQASAPATAFSIAAPDAHMTEPVRADRDIGHWMRLTLFGGIAMHAGQREIAPKHHKAKALLAYLALAPRMTGTRDCLIGLLWSESSEAKARASLRQLLHVLRDAFDREGVAAFSADKTRVSLNPALFKSDLDDMLRSIRSGYPLDCLVNEMRITETFLYGYDDADPSFGHWLRVQRESLRQLLIRALEAQLADQSRPVLHVKRIARALCQIDPTHEPACRHLMRAYVETGDVAGALLAYKCLWEHLEHDHDIEPSAATQELVVAIKRGASPLPIGGLVRLEAVPNCIPGRRRQAQHLLRA
jgi:DNA-binding SARP family transcriptional activator